MFADTPTSRFSDIPGIVFAPSRAASPEAREAVARYERPAFQIEVSSLADEAVVDLTLAALERPGTPLDYHFLLQNTVRELWRRRRESQKALPFVEEFGLLDAQLVRHHREMFHMDGPNDGFVSVPTLNVLAQLYANEGDWIAAENVAKLARTIANGVGAEERITERAASLRTEVNSE